MCVPLDTILDPSTLFDDDGGCGTAIDVATHQWKESWGGASQPADV
jgi:hypothetical protein